MTPEDEAREDRRVGTGHLYQHCCSCDYVNRQDCSGCFCHDTYAPNVAGPVLTTENMLPANPEEQGRVTASEEREAIAEWLDKEADSYAQLARSSDTVETATHWNICEMTARHAKWKIRDGAHHEGRE